MKKKIQKINKYMNYKNQCKGVFQVKLSVVIKEWLKVQWNMFGFNF